jgi:general nucleoside transport system ATP-binding protein
MNHMVPSALSLHNITKRFGALVANDNISLELASGEVLGLLGENGAGKSTLVSILFGHYVADSGWIEVFGRPLKPGDPKAALAAGIGMVHQHFTLADNLSVLDNVLLGTEPLWQPFSRRSAARARLVAVAAQFGLALEPDALVAGLSVGERQRVEIVKALYRGAKILILDEPTAVLTPQESEALFATLQSLVARGLSVIFISHKLDEVLRVCQRVAVLRAGKLAAQADARNATPAQLALWMVGHAVHLPSAAAAKAPGDIVCELHKLCAQTTARNRIHNLSLQLRAGELLAIAGVAGNGQSALADVLCGVLPAAQGKLHLAGQAWPVGAGAVQRITQRGVARIPQDRRSVGLVGDLPLWENAVSERLGTPAFSRLGWVRRAGGMAYARRVLQAFDVRGAGIQSPAKALSGGNMQKLILGRALLPPDGSTPTLIVAHQPTWGLDIGAVAYVHQQLLAARDAGAAVLLISEDLDEVMRLGDRIAVMHAGRLSPARAAPAWTREALGLAMAGALDAADAASAWS